MNDTMSLKIDHDLTVSYSTRSRQSGSEFDSDAGTLSAILSAFRGGNSSVGRASNS